ncbi:MAG: MarR family transcriptional regulator [Rhodocyclales bacterium GT-UBC]|nr:MAG: MarR family transcriptional regulator [Rhodocyclales bacterium GT-UBC]
MTIGECARIWRQRVNERLKPLGLSQAAWLALWHLSRATDGLVQAELAERLGIEGPTLVRLLDRLEKEGLVVRQASLSDRRYKRVVLTEAAGPVVSQVKAIIAGLRGEILDDIPDAELAAGLRLLERVRQRLGSA